ncbi:ATP-binding protein [Silvanigrella aquatica]|uniref:AAA+ ATPase domain-containing protein n=1 Tax=Silvanigrella aquatica TaxID=1915309 RepID=A0A1L4D1X4_9BACT|nr:ATP-binding protein [Silvanigrella aquatica]APJ04194.1 hypothetical protein AXG55_09865 [Silvanigrella aquatica]
MAKTFSYLLVGVEIFPVEIETVLGNGFSGLNILGLGTEATRDMRERVRSALESTGISIPARRVVVNITPNELIKMSRIPFSQLDFAVAASIIYALFEEQENQQSLCAPEKEFLAGELSLSGQLKEVQNALIYESALSQEKESMCLCLPKANNNMSENDNLQFYATLLEWLNKRKMKDINVQKNKEKLSDKKISIIKNQLQFFEKSSFFVSDIEENILLLMKNPKVCISLLAAAFGNHHILVAGEPGIGKSFSLQKIPQFLIPLNQKEQLEVKLIHSLSGSVKRPFRSPHHSATPAALVGGSSLKPGEVSLAHCGVLFLDELAEFSSPSLESLREPLDAGEVFLSRAGGSIRYPAKFILCATTNPCPCGFLFSKTKPCRCHPKESRKYLQKISGPLLDRFCLQVWLDPHCDVMQQDVFSQYLFKIIENGKLKDFSYHFVNTKINYLNGSYNDDTVFDMKNLIKKNEKILSLSLRGQDKIISVLQTFHAIFPEIICDENFLESVLSYRILDKMFLQKNIF